jgi:hypothetical protein
MAVLKFRAKLRICTGPGFRRPSDEKGDAVRSAKKKTENVQNENYYPKCSKLRLDPNDTSVLPAWITLASVMMIPIPSSDW